MNKFVICISGHPPSPIPRKHNPCLFLLRKSRRQISDNLFLWPSIYPEEMDGGEGDHQAKNTRGGRNLQGTFSSRSLQ